jgi:hypothetical protein
MKIIETKVYTFDELSDSAKEKARDWYRKANTSESYYLDEIYDSLKALFKAANITLKDWSLGPYNRGNQVTFDLGDASELTGRRALAWLENNLFAGLRITAHEFAKNRKDYLKYGPDYRAGKIKPCPLTGICYDEDYLDALRKSIKEGDTLRDAFRNLADVCGRLCEAECEYRDEDEQIDEDIRANEYTFTEEGELFS